MNYFGARYLDPMLGLWVSVDAARQFSSPYLYAGNGMNPVNAIDPDGNADVLGLMNGTFHMLAGIGMVSMGVSLCESMVGCAAGLFFMSLGMAEMATSLFGVVEDAENQKFAVDDFKENMTESGRDAFELYERIGTVKSIVDKDFKSFAIDFVGEKIISYEGPLKLMETEGPAPADKTSTVESW